MRDASVIGVVNGNTFVFGLGQSFGGVGSYWGGCIRGSVSGHICLGDSSGVSFYWFGFVGVLLGEVSWGLGFDLGVIVDTADDEAGGWVSPRAIIPVDKAVSFGAPLKIGCLGLCFSFSLGCCFSLSFVLGGLFYGGVSITDLLRIILSFLVCLGIFGDLFFNCFGCRFLLWLFGGLFSGFGIGSCFGFGCSFSIGFGLGLGGHGIMCGSDLTSMLFSFLIS